MELIEKSLATLLIFATLSFASTAHASLSKSAAFELMKRSSKRWKQTEYLTLGAQAKSEQAQSALLPHVGFFSREFGGRINQIQYGFSYPGDLSVFAFGTTGVNLDYSLYDAASRARIEAAKSNEKINQNNQKKFQADLTHLMLYQYLNVQRLKRSLEVMASNLEHDQKILAFAKKRVSVGAGITLDIKRAQGLIDKDEFKHVQAKTALFKACEELGVTLGESNFDCNLDPLSLHVLPDSATDVSAQKALIESKSDVLAAKYSAEAAGHLRELAENSVKPKVSFFGETGVAGEHPLGGQNSAWTGIIGVQLTFPLADGHYSRGQAQEENVKSMQAAAEKEELETEGLSQIKIARVQITDAKTAVEISNRHIDLAREELSYSERKFQTGGLSSLELSNAQVNFMTAMDMNIQAVFSYELAKVEFFQSTDSLDQYFQLETQTR